MFQEHYNDDILYFYNNVRLPEPYDFAKAFLIAHCSSKIKSFFKINKEVTDDNVSDFIYFFGHWAQNNEQIIETLPSEIHCLYSDFFSLICDDLKENYIYLKYGKKYAWAFGEKTYNVKSFINPLGLYSNDKLKKLIKWLEFKYQFIQIVKFAAFIIFFVLFYSILHYLGVEFE